MSKGNNLSIHERLNAYNWHYVWRPRGLALAGVAHKAGAFCCQHLSRPSATQRASLAAALSSSQHP
ncbi:hypothetical protein TI10_00015 [Photorhabdus luminescens subsp. luminescens]|uniref:hypothetical protein n=1 Tax=Photorhabdus TaxID=29487 RepID=UPI00066DD4D6|nr:hypothetical protein [Photorhabdus luminescens]KMW72059.1 hypothetical protein TI10_18415 [Photorhabdus luminescens subsp. luminescens]KMW72082.1 hypothetical protein TI10_15920 [Photorhabdus luminescens subsp. luminescens]KMW72428.1 hypothetical protein TI10_15875 [Photorhabdus luminescens subsp. luminescens]KMW73111.1 hypothetical protein TI10_08245 [Photorhabdus luminescens subsp. luminescens]KMW74226.1 hypothetical protein TI10_00015 [Photorhabdus luminescens subsp. luminescens]